MQFCKVSDFYSLISKDYLPREEDMLVIEPYLIDLPRSGKGGPKPKPSWRIFCAIYYRLRTGCQWNAIPKALAASSTAHQRYQYWVKEGVFKQLWQLGLLQAAMMGCLDLEWQSIDGCICKSPLGGIDSGANPTDRGKLGTKRHLLTEGGGVPIAITLTGANVHDKKEVGHLLDERPDFLVHMGADDFKQHFCGDKGYDYEDIRALITLNHYIDNILSRGEEQKNKTRIKGYKARRWVCERTHSWFNRFRAILIRWEKKTENYLNALYLVAALITWKLVIG